MKVPLSRPFYNGEIEEAILRAARKKEKKILGEECLSLEAELAKYFETKHAVLVASGTAALYLSLRVLGIRNGDEVIVPSHTAFPTGESVMHPFVGAIPRFVDIKADEFTLDTSRLDSLLTERTKAVLPVHLYGGAADMDNIMGFAKRHDLFIVEDACQAHGTIYKGRKVGSFGSAAALSFYPSKNLGGYDDGGAVLTNRDDVAERVRILRDHGRGERYEHDYVSDNLRFGEINAAILRVELKHLDEFISRRREIAVRYNEGLVDTALVLPKETEDFRHSYHLYVVMASSKETRDLLKEKLGSYGVGTEVHYPIPVHRQKGTLRYLEGLGMKVENNLMQTDCVVDKILSLPMFPTITDEEIRYVIEKVKECLKF